MTRTWIALLCLVVTLGACASVNSDFERASRINTVKSYESFLRKHPNSEFTKEAKQKADAARQRAKERKAKAAREQQARKEQQAQEKKKRKQALIKQLAAEAGQAKINSGGLWAHQVFPPDDVITAFVANGNGIVRFYYEGESVQRRGYTQKNLGYDKLRSLGDWHRFRKQMIKKLSRSPKMFVRMAVPLKVPTVTAVSSKQKGTTAKFLLEDGLLLYTDIRLSNGKIVDEQFKFGGSGAAIVNHANGKQEVFLFPTLRSWVSATKK